MTRLVSTGLALATAGLLLGGTGCGEVVPATDAGFDGGSGDGGDLPDAEPGPPCEGPDIALEDVEQCLTQVMCEKFLRCAPMPMFETMEQCLRDVAAFTAGDGPVEGARHIREIVEAGDAEYNPAAAFECLQVFREHSCKGLFQDEGSGGDDPFRTEPCARVIIGIYGQDDECFDEEHCDYGLFCSRPDCQDGDMCCVGTCQPLMDEGNNCNEHGRCLPGLFPVWLDELNCLCTDGGPGADCRSDTDCRQEGFCTNLDKCAPDLLSGSSACQRSPQCPGDEVCAQGTCSMPDEVGAPCEQVCWNGLICDYSQDPNNPSCAEPPQEGESCLDTRPCKPMSEVYCGGGWQCLTLADVDEECSFDLGSQRYGCYSTAFCSSEIDQQTPGTCLPPQDDGSPCAVDGHCQSLYCDQGIFECAPPPTCF